MASIEKIISIGAFAAPGLARGKAVWDAEQDAVRAFTEGMGVYAGFQDGQFNFGRAVGAWTPFITFNVLRWGAHKLNGLIRGL